MLVPAPFRRPEDRAHDLGLSAPDEHATAHRAIRLGKVGRRLVGQGDDARRVVAQADALHGQTDSLATALEQRRAELFLQVSKLARKRGLRHVQLLRRP